MPATKRPQATSPGLSPLAFAVSAAVVVAGLVACKAAQKRSGTSHASGADVAGTNSPAPTDSGASSTDPSATDPSPSVSDMVGSGEPTSTNLPAATAGAGGGSGQTLEECNAAGKAWRAVIDSGNSPAACSSESLVSWCCNREEALARFASRADVLQGKFDEYVDKEGLKLYACSQSGNKTTFHFAKIKDGSTTYKTFYISGIMPATTGAGTKTCKIVTTTDLGGSTSNTQSDAE